MRRNVAAAARIRVVATGAPDVAGALEDHEVLLALLPEPDRHPKARETGADDRDANVLAREWPVLCQVNLRSPGRSSSTVQSASASTSDAGCSHIQWATPSYAELMACAATSSSRGSTSSGAISRISSRIS